MRSTRGHQRTRRSSSSAGSDDNDFLPFHTDFGADSGTQFQDHSHWGDPSDDH